MDGSSPGGVDAAEFERALALLERLCALSSRSDDTAGLERAARALAGEFSARGFAAAIERRAGAHGAELPLLLARAPSTGRRPLLLLGHFDTVLDAAPPARGAERLAATGAIDMKGGIATLLAALDRLRSTGAPPRDLAVVLVPDEEVAGVVSRRATAEFGAEARACFVLEPGALRDGGVETVVAGRRGLANFRLDLAGRAAHSGLAFHQGRSAVAAAGAWIAAAAALSRPGSGPTVNCARVVGGERGFVERLAAEAGLAGSGGMLNVVADRALVEGEYRFLDPADGAATRAALERLAGEIAAASGVELRLAFAGEIAPVAATPERLRLAGRAVESARRHGFALEVEHDRGGISFPNFLPPESALPVLDGLGPAGGGMHTREEWVDLRSFARRIALLTDLLAAESEPAGQSGSSTSKS
jgi:glutamate carboxypeptidase